MSKTESLFVQFIFLLYLRLVFEQLYVLQSVSVQVKLQRNDCNCAFNSVKLTCTYVNKLISYIF